MHNLRNINRAISLHPHHLFTGIIAGALLISAQHNRARHMTNVERRLFRIIFGKRRLLGKWFHKLLRAGQRFRLRYTLRHRIGELNTLLTLLLKTGDGGKNRTLSLRDIYTTSRKRAAITQILHIKQQILTNITGRNEIAMNRIRQARRRHRFGCGHHSLRNHLTAIHAASGEIQAFTIHIHMIAVHGRRAQLKHLC